MDLEINQVHTFKLVTGEEMVAKVIASDHDYITVSEPVSVSPSPQGLGLIPSLFTADHARTIQLNKNCVAVFGVTDQSVRTRYIEATTGIRVPEKKIVLG